MAAFNDVAAGYFDSHGVVHDAGLKKFEMRSLSNQIGHMLHGALH